MVINIEPYCGVAKTYNLHKLACEIINATYLSEETIVLDLKYEGWDIVENGIEKAVKDIVDMLQLSPDRIIFKSSDKLCKSNFFKHELNTHCRNFFPHLLTVNNMKLPELDNYGMFLGRGTNERLYSFYKHKTWQHTNKGYATLHLNNAEDINELQNDYSEFIIEHNDKWQKIKNILPYTDLGHEFDVLDNIVESTQQKFWDKIYNNMSIEIVCETNTTAGTFFVTEKSLRPIAYGKLFLVVGSPEFEKNLNKMGFDIFDDIIDKSYDNECSYIRVDQVFNSLGKFIDKNYDMTSLLHRLKNNQQVLKDLQNKYPFQKISSATPMKYKIKKNE